VWFHVIKYDGYRVRPEREDDRLRPITKGGYDRIAEAGRRIGSDKNRQHQAFDRVKQAFG
jgi:ATP-dependent DNA ligase